MVTEEFMDCYGKAKCNLDESGKHYSYVGGGYSSTAHTYSNIGDVRLTGVPPTWKEIKEIYARDGNVDSNGMIGYFRDYNNNLRENGSFMSCFSGDPLTCPRIEISC